jgi:acyl-CoA thioester hydrolase
MKSRSRSSLKSARPEKIIVGETHIRVRYADTDQMKMVYHSKYLEYFEQGRSDLLRGLGIPYPEIEKMGYYLPVLEAHAKFIKSANYDDLLLVKTMMSEMAGVRITIEYAIMNTHNELIVAGYTVHSFVNARTGKPSRPPQKFIDIVNSKVSPASSTRAK